MHQKLYRFRFSGKGGNVSGTLYIPSTSQENNAIDTIARKLPYVKKAHFNKSRVSVIFSSSSSDIYETPKKYFLIIFFIDPPFGGNLMYSELNFLWEDWLNVFTNNDPEADY